jgi:hypothetical protein
MTFQNTGPQITSAPLQFIHDPMIRDSVLSETELKQTMDNLESAARKAQFPARVSNQLAPGKSAVNTIAADLLNDKQIGDISKGTLIMYVFCNLKIPR